MIPLVRRYRTNAITCVREWFWVANTHAPEVVRGIIACTRAGALALPLLPALPMVPLMGFGPGAPYPAFGSGTPGFIGSQPGAQAGGFGDIAGGAGMVSEFARGGFAAAGASGAFDIVEGSSHRFREGGPLTPAPIPMLSQAPRSSSREWGPLTQPAVSLPQFDTTLLPRAPGQTPPTTTVTIPEIVVRPDAPQDVPEPGASWAFLGVGLVAVGLINRSGRQ
jgi:hypothetical protein